MNEETTVSLKKFAEITATHVPPKGKNVILEEVCLRVPLCYRLRVRGSDANYEVVGRFTGFTVPADNNPEILILEFVAEHSYKNQDDE